MLRLRLLQLLHLLLVLLLHSLLLLHLLLLLLAGLWVSADAAFAASSLPSLFSCCQLLLLPCLFLF